MPNCNCGQIAQAIKEGANGVAGALGGVGAAIMVGLLMVGSCNFSHSDNTYKIESGLNSVARSVDGLASATRAASGSGIYTDGDKIKSGLETMAHSLDEIKEELKKK
jgi:hypothetical protein